VSNTETTPRAHISNPVASSNCPPVASAAAIDDRSWCREKGAKSARLGFSPRISPRLPMRPSGAGFWTKIAADLLNAGRNRISRVISTRPTSRSTAAWSISGLPQRPRDKFLAFWSRPDGKAGSAEIDAQTSEKYGLPPENLVTEDSRSYHSAAPDLAFEHRHRTYRWRNNRAENSHQSPSGGSAKSNDSRTWEQPKKTWRDAAAAV
jgi:hypothetical protein